MTTKAQMILALTTVAVVLYIAIKGILIPTLVTPTNDTCEGVERNVQMFSNSVEYESCNTHYVPSDEERAHYR